MEADRSQRCAWVSTLECEEPSNALLTSQMPAARVNFTPTSWKPIPPLSAATDQEGQWPMNRPHIVVGFLRQ